MKFWKIVFYRSILSSGAILLSLLIAEFAVRTFVPQPLPQINSLLWWQPTPGLGWQHPSNIDLEIPHSERVVRLITDDSGHRIGSESIIETDRRILAIGDSFIAALQINHQETLIHLLSQYVSEDLGESINVTNAGVGGWGPSQYLIKTQQELANNSYDVLLVFIYSGNDILEIHPNTFPASNPYQKNFSIPTGISRIELSYSIISPIKYHLTNNSHLYFLLKDRLRVLRVRTGISDPPFPRAFHTKEANSIQWTKTADICAEIANAASINSTKTIFILIPAHFQLDKSFLQEQAKIFGFNPDLISITQPSTLLTAELEERGLNVIDMLPAFRQAHQAGISELYGSVDKHFEVSGHQLVATELTPYVLELLLEN